MLGKVYLSSAVLSLVAVALPAHANYVEVGDKIPNVLVIKSPVKEVAPEQGQTGAQENAQLIPLQMDIPQTEQGEVDVEQLAEDCAEQESTVQAVDMKPSQYSPDQTPDQVDQEFANAEQQEGDELKQGLYWRFYSPWGSRYSGFYGYSYYPYYGYNSYYSNYYPYYGYYRYGSLYPYTWAYYRNRGGYTYNYYYRW